MSIAVTCCLLGACLLASPALAARPVEYTLAPILEAATLRALRVTMSFDGESDGETILSLPAEWGGETSLWRGLSAFQVQPPSARMAAGADSAHRVIRHEPGARLTVSYRIEQDWPGEPTAGEGNSYRPVVQPGYFHLIGHAVFATPDWASDAPATFHNPTLPAGWQFASDLEHGVGDSSLTLANLRESVLVGGDFRVLRSPGGAGLRLAIRGAWKFTDAMLYDTLLRIVASHRTFWGDPDEPFLVTVLPLLNRSGGSSLGGTGLSDAFAFFGTDNGEEATLNRILAHEHLHTWIPRRIGGMPDPDEARDYWLSEGFTDFYTFRLLVRDGIWSIDDFVAATNEVLERYAASPMRTAPNSRILEDFWSSRDVQDLPYQRGFLMAMTWDDRLRRLTGGARDLDDVMHAMKRGALADGAATDSLVATDRLRLALTAAGLDPKNDLEKHIEQGNAIFLPADLFGPNAVVETVERPEFTRGFDPAATTAANNVVAGVDPAGPAYAAGLRDGMTILKREAGKPGDSRVELVYLVRDGDAEKRIRYLPEGKRRFVTQQVVPTSELDDAGRRALARRIGGEPTTSARPAILQRAAAHVGSASHIESIEALHTQAHVQAPSGAFEMTVISARDGRVHFMQQGRFSAGVDRQGGWIWDAETSGRAPLDSLTASIITGHELHLLVLAPETRWSWTGQVRDSVFAGHPAVMAEFRDELGSPALACYAKSDSLPLGFIMMNASGRGEARIEVELGGWQRRGEWNWFERATFRQGEALFEYQYHDIRSVAADDSLFAPRPPS